MSHRGFSLTHVFVLGDPLQFLQGARKTQFWAVFSTRVRIGGLLFHNWEECGKHKCCALTITIFIPDLVRVGSSVITVTVTGTAVVKKSLLGLDSWIAAAEEVSLQTASEGGKRRCRRDVLRQTVPNTGCSDWKGPVADS